MKTANWLLLAAALHCASGCARPDWIEQTLVTENDTGAWYGLAESFPTVSLEIHLDLEQQGPKVKGSARGRGFYGGSYEGPIEGSVAGDVFSFRQTNGPLRGELTVSGDEMTGRVFGGFKDVPIAFHRVSPAPRPNPSSP